MANKRGRPKSDRPKIDLGTPELIKHRITMAPKDPTLATSPIDTLLARGVISEEAHTAAIYFNALRKLVYGKAHPGAIDLTAVSKGGIPEEMDTADAQRKYHDACNFIKGQSRQCLDAVENLVTHERWPQWMFAGSAKTDRWRQYFLSGLGALLAWYKGERRRAA